MRPAHLALLKLILKVSVLTSINYKISLEAKRYVESQNALNAGDSFTEFLADFFIPVSDWARIWGSFTIVYWIWCFFFGGDDGASGPGDFGGGWW